jgi:hypothetical protein
MTGTRELRTMVERPIKADAARMITKSTQTGDYVLWFMSMGKEKSKQACPHPLTWAFK